MNFEINQKTVHSNNMNFTYFSRLCIQKVERFRKSKLLRNRNL